MSETVSCCGTGKLHPDHSKQLNRISRIIGQLEGVRRMIEERRYCPDILTQTKAVYSAVRSLEASVLERHLKDCVSEAMTTDNQNLTKEKIEELLEIFRARG